MSRIMLRSFLSLAVAAAVSGSAALAQGWGTVEGRFVLEGNVPAPAIVVEKGGDVRDAQVCAVQNLYSEELVVNPENKGIANIFVYLRKAPSAIHPDLKQPPKEPLVFDQKACTFIPHALVVRTGQEVLVKSDDAIPHNTHTHPLRNQGDNILVTPDDRKGVPITYQLPEPVPTMVNCDIHPHMRAYWLIVDHPYAVVTDADGKFRIENLPEGEHTLSAWQERVGYVDRALDRKFTVTVKDGQVTQLEPIKVPAATFEE